MSKSPKTVRAYWLGRIGYRPCWDLQRALVEEVRAGTAPSTLLLLEHEPVFSMGRRATLGGRWGGVHFGHQLAHSPEVRQVEGVHEADREDVDQQRG